MTVMTQGRGATLGKETAIRKLIFTVATSTWLEPSQTISTAVGGLAAPELGAMNGRINADIVGWYEGARKRSTA